MPRGGQKYKLSANVTPDEYEAIQTIIHTPVARDYFETEMQTFIRWLIGAFAADFQEQVAEAKPVFTRLMESNRLESRRFVASQIDGFMQERAFELHLLLDKDMLEDALNLYRDVLTQLRSEPDPWKKAFESSFFKSAEIERFRLRYTVLGEVEDLKEIEKYAGSTGEIKE